MSLIRRATVVLFAIFASSCAALAQPVLNDLFPRGLLSGSATKLTLYGDNLTKEDSIWISCPAKIDHFATADDGKSATCEVEVPTGCPPSVIGIVVGNKNGVADPMFAMLDDLGSLKDNGANHDIDKPQAISWPIAVDGKCDGVRFDYYQFELNQHQRVAVEIVAQRMASTMDPVIRLLDPNGREVAFADDDPGMGADCRFEYVATQAGNYVLEVRDNRYQAGGNYRLRIGDFPIVTSAFPLGGRRGTTSRFRFLSFAECEFEPTIERIPRDGIDRRIPITARLPGGISSALVEVASSNLPESAEAKNDNPQDVTELTVPCAVSGILSEPNEQDTYEFPLTKGQRIECAGYARAYGSPTHVFMRLLDPDGNLVTETAVGDGEDTIITHTTGRQGIYQLKVRDLLHRGGASFTYRIALRSGPSFSVQMKQETNTKTKFHVPLDGAIPLTIQIQRKKFTGPIRIEPQDPHAKFKVFNGVFTADEKEKRVFIVPQGTGDGGLRTFRLVGVAETNQHVIRRLVQTEQTIRAKYPQLLYPHAWLNGLLATTISPEAKPLFKLPSDHEPIELARNRQVEHSISVERLAKGFTSKLHWSPLSLPPAIHVSVNIEKEKYTIKITCGTNTPLGEHRIQLMAFGEHQGIGRYVRYEIPVRILPTKKQDAKKQN